MFEDFVRDKKAFLEELAAFCGFDPHPEILESGTKDNSRLSQRWLNMARFKKAILGEFVVKGVRTIAPSPVLDIWGKILTGGKKADVNWPVTIRKQLDALYADGNKKLAEETGLDLAANGYVVEAPVDVDYDGPFGDIVPTAMWLPSGYQIIN